MSRNARATNTVQGDFQSASIGTFMAINGDGFFVVQKPASFVDGRPTFDGIDLYTRRGDFQPDKNGYLVNGAGYYLMGIPVDATTGNLAGSVPQLLKFQNDFLPAQPTTQIEYRANLASYPLTPQHDTNVPGSELIDPKTFSANPVAGAPAPAKITGFGATLLAGCRPRASPARRRCRRRMTQRRLLHASTARTVNVTAGMTPAQVLDRDQHANAGGLPAWHATPRSSPADISCSTSADADTQIAIERLEPADARRARDCRSARSIRPTC